MPLFPEQCRAARGLLNWTQGQLASASGLSRSTIKDFECHRHTLNRTSEALLVGTLMRCGVELLSDDNMIPGVGVRMRLGKRGGHRG